MTDACPFCLPEPDRVFLHGERVVALWDRFPVSPGHALIVPRRHVATWFDATPAEQEELIATIERVRETIESEHRPDGFNIGIGVGAAGGQTVAVIPRYDGDAPDPRGGVRHVIPAKGNYLTDSAAGVGQLDEGARVGWSSASL